ncbi:MAG: T6SS immunity protein Tli4 family protein [Candidatus Manganitrophaceae bacterium]
MLEWIIGIAKNYRFVDSTGNTSNENWFYLQHGAINLPYLEQEKAYVRFEGHPLGLTLEIKMNSTHETRPVPNLLERIEVAIRERFAPGLDVSRVRTQKRTVAGIPGEEVILRMTERGKTSFLFGWDYLGRKDSGEYPRIVIKMDAFDDKHLQEQTLLWDRMLDSMKPMYKQ